MPQTYVVTGGAGFIGSHIAAQLLKEGHRVHVVDSLIAGQQRNLDHLTGLAGDFTHHAVSITDLDALRPIFSGADVVFHQAALASVQLSISDPLLTHEHSLTGTLNVLIAARDAGVRRVVYAASAAAYGDEERDSQSEDQTPGPLSPYGVAKLAGEYYCRSFTEVYGLETVSLRYFNVFGPRQDATVQYAVVVPLFIKAMLRGQAPTIYGDGLQSRDFVYVDNIVQGNLLAAHAPEAAGEVINIATGQRVTLLELVASINRILGTQIDPIHAEPRPGDIRHSRADIQKARDLLDYAPVVDFEAGLARTIEFYRDES